MSRPADFRIERRADGFLIIRDTGDHTRQLTVTNDADSVVRRCVRDGLLRPGQRLFAFDSDGNLDELLIDANGEFFGFRAARLDKMPGRNS